MALTQTIPPANASADQLVEPSAATYSRITYPVGPLYWAPTNFGELYNTLTIGGPRSPPSSGASCAAGRCWTRSAGSA